MYSIGYFILDIVMVVSTLWIVDRFWSNFFEKRKSIFSVVLWFCFMLWQLNFIWDDLSVKST